MKPYYINLSLLLFLFFGTFLLKSETTPFSQQPDDSIKILNNLSHAFLDKNPQKALAYGKEALEASERLNFKSGTARALNNLGLYYKGQGKIEMALEYFSKSLQTSREVNDTALIVHSLTNVARIFVYQGVKEKAQEYLLQALQLSKSSNDLLATAHTLNALGALHYSLKEYDVALNYFGKCMKYRKQKNDRNGIAASLNNIGVVHKAKKNYQKALGYYLRAIHLMEEQESIKNLSQAHLNIGQLYELLGDFNKARTYYDLGLKAALQVNSSAIIMEAYDYLAKFYVNRNQYKEAYEYKNLFGIYKDSLHKEEVSSQLAEMVNKFELEKKEKEYNSILNKQQIALLNKENLIQKFELKEKRYQNYFLIGGFIFIALFAIILLITNRGKMRLNEILKEKNKRNSSQNHELKKINDKLTRSEAELRELNNYKNKFFSIIGHDLKSPLNTLLGLLQLLRRDFNSFSEQELKQLTADMERSLRGLSGLLDNLLQWSLSQMDNLDVRPERINMSQIINENVFLVNSNTKFKKISISVKIDKDLHAFADVNMIKLVFRNLISNAVKFTPKGGHIKIAAETEGKEIKIYVQDSGIGISEENQKRLFSIGDRYSIKGTENEKGTGLGLIICKEFVELNNGNIALESKVDEGTTFIINLPNQSVPLASLEAAQLSLN